MDWIMSGGGPLICLETRCKKSWGGVDRLTVVCADANTDYDRACRARDYTSVIPLRNGSGLVLGGGPIDTSLWYAKSGAFLIVQVFCSEADVHEEAYLAGMNDTIFSNPIQRAEFSFGSEELILFDSAEPGDDIIGQSISFHIDPGRYRILTQTFDPSPDISFLLHKFEKTASPSST